MKQAGKITSNFSFEGKLAKVNRKKNKVKYIKLATAQGKYWIKIGKNLRQEVADLVCGCQLEIAGSSKQSKKKGKIKYKAQTIAVVPQSNEDKPEIKTKIVSLLPVFDSKTKSKAKVLVCQKSNCWKKGGKEVYSELESIFGDRNLGDLIPIKKTGCLNKCKKAPNLVMLPDKARYTKVKPKQIKDLVEKHLIVET